MALPGEKKPKTIASLVVSDTALSVSAFVIRNPDENHAEVYRFLLRRNLRLPGLAYSVDKGDVRHRPDAGCRRRRRLPRQCLLGVVLTACDEPFNEPARHGLPVLHAQGVEWRPRAVREPAQLEAFRGILAGLGRPRIRDRRPPGPRRPRWLGWRHDRTHAHPAAPRRVRMEPEEPVHGVGRRRPHRQAAPRPRAVVS